MKLNNNYKTLLKAYTQHLQTLGFATTTVYNYPLFINHFFLYLQNKNIHHIKYLTSSHIYTYFKYLEQSKGIRTNKTFSTSHLNTRFFAIDTFLEFLHHIGMNNTPSPLKYSIEHKAHKPIIVLSIEQIKTLYNTIPLLFTDYTMAQREPRQACVRLVLDLCYGCGLRRSEALNLKINDINFDTKIIHIKQGKNYKDRLVPMSDGIYKSIQIFIYQYRKHLDYKKANYVYPFKSYAIAEALEMLINKSNDEELKTNKPTLHSLRHSIATHLLQKGMSIDNIARFLGHSTLQSTQIYTHLIST